MEHVFVLLAERAVVGDKVSTEVSVFASRDDARDSWNCVVCEETRYITENMTDWVVMDDDSDELFFKAGIPDSFCGNHVVVKVVECKVD